MFFGKAKGACIICLSPCHVRWGEAEAFYGCAWQTEFPAAILHLHRDDLPVRFHPYFPFDVNLHKNLWNPEYA